MSIPPSVLGPRPPSVEFSLPLLKNSPKDSLAFRIRKTWQDTLELTKKCAALHRETLKEISSCIEIKPGKLSWQQTLQTILSVWIKEKKHDKLFKASPQFIAHCQEMFFQYLESEEALEKYTPIAPYIILIDSIASVHPSRLTEILFKKNSRQSTVLEQLLNLGHPSLKIIGDHIAEPIVRRLQLGHSSEDLLPKLFMAFRSDMHPELTVEQLENVQQGLDSICPHLADIFQLQTFLLQKNKEAAFSLLSRFHQEHILWIDQIPSFKELCMTMIPNKIASIVRMDLNNIMNWALYFTHESLFDALSRIERPVSPLEVFRCDNFIELLKKLKPLDFWIIGRSNNPIIHEIMGYIMDELKLIQIKSYLHGLDESFLPNLLSSLHPKNFQRVLTSFSKAFFEAYSKKYYDNFFPKKYDLSHEVLSNLEQTYKDKASSALILVEGWLIPGAEEIKLWIKALKNLPSFCKGYFNDLIVVLEEDYKRYQTLIAKVNQDQCVEVSFPFYCPLNDMPIMNPVKIRLSHDRNVLYDKSSLMALRPLLDPNSGSAFSFFQITIEGSAHLTIQDFLKPFKLRTIKSSRPLNR